MFRTVLRNAATRAGAVAVARRASVVSGPAVLAVLAVTMSLSACGPLQLGAAAIVGPDRISTSTLSSDVANLTADYQAHPSLQREVQYTPAQMPRLVLMWLVRFRIVADIARHNGVQVSDAQAQRALAEATALTERQTGMMVGPAELGLLSAIPPNLVGEFGRYEATIEQLALVYTGARSVSALTPAQQQVFSTRIKSDVDAALKRLNIKINPRFGQFNVSQLTVVAAADRLSRPENAA